MFYNSLIQYSGVQYHISKSMFMVNLSVHLGLQLSVVRLTFIAEGLNAVGHSLLIIF